MDTGGRRRGTHDGIAFYTIGQRRRLNVGSPIPLYVVGINAETNTITVGGNDDLMAEGLAADDINWVGISSVQESLQVLVKIRYNMEPVPAVVQNGARNGEIVVRFDTPQRAVTPGQSLVMYDVSGDSVLGGANHSMPSLSESDDPDMLDRDQHLSDQHTSNHHISIGLLILAGIGAGAVTGTLLGLLATRRPRAQAREEIGETVDDLKRRAEQILTELSQTYMASAETPRSY